MQTTTQQARILAGNKLDAARKHSRALGAALTPQSSPMLVDWYMSALNAEETARAEYSAALDAETNARAFQARAAFLI